MHGLIAFLGAPPHGLQSRDDYKHGRRAPCQNHRRKDKRPGRGPRPQHRHPDLRSPHIPSRLPKAQFPLQSLFGSSMSGSSSLHKASISQQEKGQRIMRAFPAIGLLQILTSPTFCDNRVAKCKGCASKSQERADSRTTPRTTLCGKGWRLGELIIDN